MILATFVVTVVIIGLFQISNYIEFGPSVWFYRSKTCVINRNQPDDSCLVFSRTSSMYRGKPTALKSVIDSLVTDSVNEKYGDYQFAQEVDGWECELKRCIISDISAKLTKDKKYNCWPRN